MADRPLHWMPAPDHDSEAVLYYGDDGWYLKLPAGERVDLANVPSSPFSEVAAVSAALDVLSDRGLWTAGGQQYWRRYGERPAPEAPSGLGLASPAAWREQHT